ncbi:MAG TPA: carboxy terminal-processing peptidase [Steroidobacteraceae bacterium]|nr:carboxy terminal-processing peptidase [Steroidobacteraceae bacterium]
MTLRFTRRASGWFITCLTVVMVLALASSSRAPADTSVVPPGAIAPTERQRMIARRVGSILEETHYSRRTIDDKMSSQIYDRYLEFLDGQHSYFLASDIAEFERYRYSFDDMIHTGDIDPAFAIFARFQQRNRERMRYALSLLGTEPNLNTEEAFQFDRTHSSWPADEAAMNDLWRKRVDNDVLSLMLTGKPWKDVAEVLRKRYEHVLKRLDQVSSEDVFEELMNAYARTFDPHSSFFSPRDSEEYRIQMSLNYEGIGASLQLVDDYVTVMNVIQGGPAAVAGTLSTNDRITGVGQGKDGPLTDVIGWRLDDVVQLIRGKAGTTVKLQVLPAGATPGTPEKTLLFVRNKVTLEAQAAKAEVRQVVRAGRTYKIGVITVPGFYEDVAAQNAGDEDYRSTTRDVRRLIVGLKSQGIDGLVLDLRENGGGYLPEATALTGLFIDKGPVVQLKDTTGRLEVLDDPDQGPAYTGPLAVLVDRYSASASEIFAAAIQDYHRGVIVGQRTFGKGTVQNLVPLDRWSQRPINGQLTVTIGKFYRVTGESTQHRGVEPDVPLPSPIDMDEVGESSLEAALPWDRIAPVPFAPWHSELHPAIAWPTLAIQEDRREEHDPDFRWLVEEISASEDMRGEKSISLNLKTREEERAREDRDELARENLRRAADGQPAIKSIDAMDPTQESNIVLAQATQVVGDMITGVPAAAPAGLPPRETARRDVATDATAARVGAQRPN